MKNNHCVTQTLVVLCAALCVVAVAATTASATHFRYSHVTWKPTGTANAFSQEIEFTITSAFRRNAYSGTASDGYLAVGNTFFESITETQLAFGDGSTTGTLTYTTTAIDPAQNYAIGEVKVRHTYVCLSGPCNFVAQLTDDDFSPCCRIRHCSSPNAHINADITSGSFNGGPYLVETVVNVMTDNSSPVSSLPPIVQCASNGLCQFPVPVSDNEGDFVKFRLATNAESDIGEQPGTGSGCTGGSATIDPVTGVYSWDTTGCHQAVDECGISASNWHSLYSSQVVIEECTDATLTQCGAAVNKAQVALDFLIELITCPIPGNRSPSFVATPSMACGTTISATPGDTISFDVEATDIDGDTITLNVASLPVGATMTPMLPVVNTPPLTSSFSWTVGANDSGQHIVNFTARDLCQLATCPVVIDVSEEICGNCIDDDNDGTVDCDDLDCQWDSSCQPGCCATSNGCAEAVPQAECSCNNGTFDASANVMCYATTGQCVTQVCGNGVVEGAEECDPGADVAGDCCQADCTYEGSGVTCDDGQFCSENETCDGAGVCGAGTAIDCSAFDDQCNTGVCNESADTCEAQPANEGSACDDSAFCTTGETCTAGTCDGGGATDCSAFDDQCNTGVCNEGNDTCEAQPANEGNVCNDGAFCTTGETCTAGTCDGGGATDCSAFDDQCNTGTCNENADTCEAQPANEGNVCNDGAFCTTGETCTAGTCDGGGATDCSAFDDQCNIGVCNEGNDTCEAQPANEGTACDDGAFCTTGETCTAGTCDGGGATNCTAFDDQCNVGICNEGADTCEAQPVNEGNTCDDGAFCTTGETCTAGTCNGGGATDCSTFDDQCNVGVCDEGNNTCEAQPANEGNACNDGAFCTTGETCSAGTCDGGGATDCTAFDDQCNVGICNEGADTCEAQPANEGATCDDGDACRIAETCQSGMCTGGVAPTCPGVDTCNTTTCDPLGLEGNCDLTIPANEGSLCEDGIFCNGAETCTNGVCTNSTGDPCPGPDGDGNCVESCNEVFDLCVAPDPDVTPCDDGNYCNGTESCIFGVCTNSTGDPCIGADGDGDCAESCDESNDNCVGTDPDGSPCQTSDFCTVDSTCTSGACGGGVPNDCSDGNSCTLDSCDEGNDQCLHVPDVSQDGVPCDDGDFCTESTACVAGNCTDGTLIDCSDGIDCTADSCDSAAASCVNVPTEEHRDCVDSCFDAIDNDGDSDSDFEDDGCATLAVAQRFAIIQTVPKKERRVQLGVDVDVDSVSGMLGITLPNPVPPFPLGPSRAGVCGHRVWMRAGSSVGLLATPLNGHASPPKPNNEFEKGTEEILDPLTGTLTDLRHIEIREGYYSDGGIDDLRDPAPYVGYGVCSEDGVTPCAHEEHDCTGTCDGRYRLDAIPNPYVDMTGTAEDFLRCQSAITAIPDIVAAFETLSGTGTTFKDHPDMGDNTFAVPVDGAVTVNVGTGLQVLEGSKIEVKQGGILTFAGDANTTLVVLLGGGFRMGPGARIELSGIPIEQSIFVQVGNIGSPLFQQFSEFRAGTIISPEQLKIFIRNNSVVEGALIGRRIILEQNVQVIHRPFIGMVQ